MRRLAAVPAFKPAYLIHGDDHGRVGERRARLRALAEQEGGVSGAEVFEGDDATPEAVAAALSAMTFATGRRFLIVDGVERWREKDVDKHIAPALAAMPPETTVAFFAREESRTKAPAALHAAVKAAGGDVSAEGAVKPWELPKWVRAQAQRLGLEMDAAAAQALIAHVGERQQRLTRELETLALEVGAGARVGADDIDERAADSAERKIWSLADLLVARDAPAATRCYLQLRAQGERLPSLLFWMTQRVRQAYDVVCRLDAGEAPAEIKRTLRMPSRAADRFIADARRADVASLRAAIEALADLEVSSRGGTELDEDTAALRTIEQIAA
ncbi:MAG: DNA polymerase III subunit delta [Actinobacteria bacterium]|nr:MAG: DNA polymerase III subunit delta [Actinomycetota bacterium]